MFDRRTFLLGLGIGIIIGALLFKLFEIGESSESNLQKISNELNASDSAAQASDAGATSKPNAGDDPAAPAATMTPAPAGAISDKKQGSEGEGAGLAEEDFMIRVKAGLTLEEGAQVLEDNKVISDAEAFTARMQAHGNRIRAGFFLFHRGMSIDDVMSIVTSTPMQEEEVRQYMQEHPEVAKSE
ncbi:hypothetical protein [Paenibacillus sp. HB172176]|uniref:hypothetical protein n=1 Tax=Paenibacillus sp. HB172176 TaxID=2493690 RepID=UPI0014396913|nr:hypothetical protein [Paenibacillus sp. HB172176]